VEDSRPRCWRTAATGEIAIGEVELRPADDPRHFQIIWQGRLAGPRVPAIENDALPDLNRGHDERERGIALSGTGDIQFYPITSMALTLFQVMKRNGKKWPEMET
jgi:hypothetical protein